MSTPYDTAAIIGVGLLGGSLGLALKARNLADTVLGVGHRAASIDAALEIGAIDEGFMDAREACRDADLIILCTPAALVAPKVDEIFPVLRPNALITDVASTKADICAHAARHWPKPLRFVGSHPMAGSEKWGPEHSSASLYEGCYTIVTPQPDQDPEALDAIHALWEDLGAAVVTCSPEQHDALVARTSHVPHIVSAALAVLAANSDRPADVRPFIGKGFADTTRIAAGRPEIWRDICLTNRSAILNSLDSLLDQLQTVRDLIGEEAGDDLEDFFTAGQQARDELLEDGAI